MSDLVQPVPLTVVIVHRGARVLLGHKQTGLGAGYWNGFGGKVGSGETVVAAARRELWEEAGIKASALHQHGVIHALFSSDEAVADLHLSPTRVSRELHIHVFRVTQYRGRPKPSVEMHPEWWSVNSLPYSQMWPSDPLWLPLLLAGKYFTLRASFRDSGTMLQATVKELAQPPISWHNEDILL